MQEHRSAVRRATVDDVDVLVTLRAEMFSSMGIPSAGGRWRERAEQWFADRVDDPSFGIFVVVRDPGVVLSCAVGAIRDAAPSPRVPDGRDVLISNVCTRADCRRQGHGRRVFEAVMDWARTTGVRRVELMATGQGLGMYQRAGFEVTRSPAMRATLG